MVENPKPHPDIYIKASSLLKMNPQDCLVIEDSPTGIQSASEAYCIPMAITSTYSREELTRYTNLVSESFAEISGFLFNEFK
jgi:beta-phosphoglucomutase-like phosphatase (HAD superfamily)